MRVDACNLTPETIKHMIYQNNGGEKMFPLHEGQKFEGQD